MAETFDFIEAYPNAVSQDFCKELIEHFDFCEEQNNLTVYRDTSAVRDNQMFFADASAFGEEKFKDGFTLRGLHRRFAEPFFEACKKTTSLYAEKYSILRGLGAHTIYDIKVQKTRPGEGFTEWHFEAGDISTSRRFLTYMLYLNDIEEGGETDFLYQKKRFKPKAGTMLLWPAGYTHTHRGNSPSKETKYIITTWMEFAD